MFITPDQHCQNVSTVDDSFPLRKTSMSSDLSNKINCLPKQRGFEIAFLNIVRLPKRFDEINFNMSNKLFDIFSFSETRLDSTITDNMINIDGYNVIRKDRDRNGGCVCIYLRNSINYQTRHDLIPRDLEAICLEKTI
jgi:hypothetical protein